MPTSPPKRDGWPEWVVYGSFAIGSVFTILGIDSKAESEATHLAVAAVSYAVCGGIGLWRGLRSSGQ